MPNERIAEVRAAALAAARLPTQVTQAWQTTPPVPAERQVWRARWDDVAALVVILGAARSTFHAAVVTATPELADDSALIVDEDATGLGSSVAVWDRLATSLPIRVLDRYLTTLEPDTLSEAHAHRGAGTRSDADRRVEARAEIEDNLESLQSATWLPTLTEDLKGLLDLSGVSSRLMEIEELGAADLLRISRATHPLSEPEAVALARVSGLPVERWQHAGPRLPDQLVDELDQPSVRSRIDELARRTAADEITTWRRVAFDVYALAARQTGVRKEPDWHQRIDHYLHGEGA